MVNIKNHFTARTGALEKSNQDFDTASKQAMKHYDVFMFIFYHHRVHDGRHRPRSQ